MAVAVLGAAGFIGHRLLARLVADGHDVRAVDFAPPSQPWRLPSWMSATERLLVDLRHPASAERAIEGCDVVFHLAANVGGVGYLNPDNDYRPWFDNARQTMNVLDACELHGVERMFYASSSCAYPTTMQRHERTVLLTESRVDTGPADLMYGREKMIGALLCQRAPFDARVGYINSAYGPGLAIHGERMKFPAAIVRKVLASRATGDPVSVWGDGSQRRSYIYVDDVVNKIVTIADDPYDGPVNITTTPSVSCDEVTRLALKLCDVDVPIVYEDGPTGVMHREVSNAKWEATYGPDRTPPFEQRFAEFVDWMQEVTADDFAA